MTESALFDKVYGSIIAAAAGDALGAMVEGWHFRDILNAYGVLVDFTQQPAQEFRYGTYPAYQVEYRGWQRSEQPFAGHGVHPYARWSERPGVYTDDMRYRILAYEAFIEKQERITGLEFARKLLQYRFESINTDNELQKTWANEMFDIETLVQTATGAPFFFHAVYGGWGGPAGIINACDPVLAAQDGAVMGAVVAEAMKPDTTIDSIMGAAFDASESFPGLKSVSKVCDTADVQFCKRLEDAMSLAEKARGDVIALIEYFYETQLYSYPPFDLVYPMEMIPVCLAMFYATEGDVERTVTGCVNFGRDCDSTAAMAGELAGAFRGAKQVPERWTRQVLEMNPEPDLRCLAQQVTDSLVNKTRRCQLINERILGQV